ncbi:TolC family protein [Pseudomarimonas arenosa]|uniref:TolC family protein n=1 Tax=Pseudomarimonas arenosa TaxID=2774145 RepID=A0AAW3ZFI1_9GAMM|nr:TolC family protein [Pseudomarimonas arenosa]MBD8524374.1 TolC family protein [Pseudomarimonas arenosa]
MDFHAVARARWLASGVLLAAHSLSSAHAAIPLDSPCAVRQAWSDHPASEAAEQTLAAARARAEASSLPLYNPDLEVAVDKEGGDRTSTAGLSLTLDLFGKRDANRALGVAEYDAAAAEAAYRRSAFAQQWLLASIDRQSALSRRDLDLQRLALMQRFADLAQRQFDAGDVSAPERDLAALARDQAEAEHAALLADVARAEEAFRAVGGATSTSDFAKCTSQNLVLDADFDPWRTPEGRLARANQQAAAQRVSVADRARRADPTLSIKAGRIELGPTTDNVLGFSVSVPLQFRNPYRAEVTAARAEAEAASAEQARIERELIARAERAKSTLSALKAAWQRWQAGPGARLGERTDLLERLWRAGELSTADYLTQLNQSLATAFAGVDLQGQAARAEVEALYATGRLDAWIGFDAPHSENTP